MISKKELQNIREEYSSKELLKSSLALNPISQFKDWFEEALSANIAEVNAMTLATCGTNGQPSARVVLLKSVSQDGFVFYTNYISTKGKQMAENPKVATTFFWNELERQVRIEGVVEKVSEEESEEYFRSRPRLSQLGAVVSDQSSEIENREELIKRMDLVTQKFEGKNVIKPKHWGGYIIKPTLIEFWQGRPGRLHDRLQYELIEGEWNITRLCP
jgi:pyridoxamine 5'-phosphate oxidase